MEKKKALVTGAGTGIGQGIAAALGKAGYDVVVHYNASAAGAQETVRMVQAAGARAWAVQADLTKKRRSTACLKPHWRIWEDSISTSTIPA